MTERWRRFLGELRRAIDPVRVGLEEENEALRQQNSDMVDCLLWYEELVAVLEDRRAAGFALPDEVVALLERVGDE